jgi:GNAT superfamily N-acetyltransferase
VIESSLLILPAIPGLTKGLDIDGVQGRVTPSLSNPWVNLVGLAALTGENVVQTIQQVHGYFTGLGLAYGWVVSHSSTPEDLGERLKAKGLWREATMEGMVYSHLDQPIITKPDVHIRQATEQDRATLLKLYADAYSMGAQFGAVWLKLIESVGGRHYLAYLDGEDEPVAMANMFYFPGEPVAVLQGAATLPQFRRQGAYTALMARRLSDAHRDGMEAAILQAAKHTSAPICRRLGFRSLCKLAFYAWY